jgi:hypothetical protein
MDALVTALSAAMEQLNTVVNYLSSHDLNVAAKTEGTMYDDTALEGIEATQCRLVAAGQMVHADSLQAVHDRLTKLYSGAYSTSPERLERAINDIIRGIIDVKLDIEHKLEHGLGSSFSSKEFELRESVVTATFTHMSLVENYLHQILRRKALASSLARKPFGDESVLRLTLALNRYLNKTDQGYEELRQAVRDADSGKPDLDLLYGLGREYLDEQQDMPDRKAIELSLELLSEIAGALSFAGMEREGRVMEQCHKWLCAASKAGSVREDDAFRCFADAFAQIELHLQRLISDPLDDTSHLLAMAEQRAARLETLIGELSSGAAVADTNWVQAKNTVQDTEIAPQFRQVFIEESEEIVMEILRLEEIWSDDPHDDTVLRELRRHFHTFKGNGRAVGANILGELGWAVQDMLDRVLDGDLQPDLKVQDLIDEVVAALPALVMSYKSDEGLDSATVRKLTNRCFRMAACAGDDLAQKLPQTDDSLCGVGSEPIDASLPETLGH